VALKTILDTYKEKGTATLLPMLDRFLIQKDAKEKANSDRAKGCIHPSQIHVCMRCQVYDIIGAPMDTAGGAAINPKLARIFGNGHSMHDRFQKYFIQMGITDEKGVEVKLRSAELNVTGSADGVIQLNGTPYVLELKSMNDIQFSQLKKPKPEHVRQVHLYMEILKIDRAIILYENKNNQECKEFLEMRDQKIVDELKARCRAINKALATKTLPEREMCKAPTDPGAKYCQYTKLCFSQKQFKDALDEKLWDTIYKNLPPSMKVEIRNRTKPVEKPATKKVLRFTIKR
jgi:hypothetical protein